MKKILTILLLFVFLASTFSITLARSDSSGPDGPSLSSMNDDDSDDESTDDSISTTVTDSAIAALIKDLPKTTDDYAAVVKTCKERAEIKFPNVDDSRLQARCRILVFAHLNQESKAQVRDQVKEKVQTAFANAGSDVRARLAVAIKNKLAAADILTTLSADDAEKFALLSRARQETLLKMTERERTSYLAKLKIQKREVKTSTLSKEMKEQYKKEYEAAKDKYKEIKEAFKIKKSSFESAVEEEESCKNQDTPECDTIREDAVTRAREHLTSLADLIIASLDKLKAKIQESDLSEAEKTKHITDIDAKITEVKEAKDNIAEATTKAEVKEAARNLINAWKRIQTRVRQAAVGVLQRDINGILEQSERLEARLNAILAKMEEDGIDTSIIQDEVDKFSMYVTSARDKYAKAKALYDQAQTSATDQKKQIEEANVLLRSAHEDLKAAALILKDITRMINDEGASLDDAVEDEYEVVETSPPTLPDERIWTESDLATIDAKQCWGDKPAYTPGTGAAYYIWQGTCAHFWWLDWTGSAGRKPVDDAAGSTAADTKEGWHTMEGTIKTNGRIIDSGVRKFEEFDRFQVRHNEIVFKSRVGPGFDGIYFRTTGNKVEFDIKIDGIEQPKKVYIGKALSNPTDIPFVLKGVPGKSRGICSDTEVAYQGKCATEIKGEVLDVTTDPGDKILEYEEAEAAPETSDGTVTLAASLT